MLSKIKLLYVAIFAQRSMEKDYDGANLPINQRHVIYNHF